MARMCFQRLKRKTERTIMSIMEDMTLRNKLIDMLKLIEDKDDLDALLKIAQIVRRSEEKFKIVEKLRWDVVCRMEVLSLFFERGK